MGWDNVKSMDNNNNSKDVKYFKAQQGVHIVRILDDGPHSRFIHWIQNANKGKGVSIDCIGANCPVCAQIKAERDAGQKQPTYIKRFVHSINVYTKKQNGQDVNEVQVLEKGNNVFLPMKDSMAVLEAMGLGSDLMNVDLMIQVSGPANKPVYSINPLPQTINQNNTPDGKPFSELEKYDCTNLKPMLTADQITALMNGAGLDEITGNGTQEETSEDAGELVLE